MHRAQIVDFTVADPRGEPTILRLKFAPSCFEIMGPKVCNTCCEGRSRICFSVCKIIGWGTSLGNYRPLREILDPPLNNLYFFIAYPQNSHC